MRGKAAEEAEYEGFGPCLLPWRGAAGAAMQRVGLDFGEQALQTPVHRRIMASGA